MVRGSPMKESEVSNGTSAAVAGFLAANARRVLWCLLAWPALVPQPALAHITQGPIGGFEGGFTHPLTGLDHFLAMFAVGVWGAQMGGRSVWALPVAFPLVMTVGGIVGMSGLVL